MRVALVPSAFAPAVGGVEVFTAEVAGGLGAAGHEVEVWTSWHGAQGQPSRDLLSGTRVHRFDFPMPRASVRALAVWPWLAVLALLRLLVVARRFRPDVINVHCFSGNGVYAAVVARLLRIPLVVSLHGETVMDEQDIYEHSAALRLGLSKALTQATAVTACSQFVLDDAVKRFDLCPDRGTVLLNAVREDAEGSVDPPLFDLPYDQYFVGVGRLTPKKGFDLLVNAFSQVPEPFGLVLVGTGREEPKLVKLVSLLGLQERVHFTGVLRGDQLRSVVGHARALVMPSRIEPFGIVALDAWREGTALVATEHGGPSEFVNHGRDGLLVDPNTPSLAEALCTLAADGDLAVGLGQAGRLRLREFSWTRVTTTLLTMYGLQPVNCESRADVRTKGRNADDPH